MCTRAPLALVRPVSDPAAALCRYGDQFARGRQGDGENGWGYKDAWASRKCNVTGPSTTFNMNDWEIAAEDCSDGSVNNADSACSYPIR